MRDKGGQFCNGKKFCCLKSYVVIRTGVIDNTGDMNITCRRERMTDADPRTEASGSQRDEADMLRDAQRGIYSDNKRI